jgi:pimeloyl-ACP methyl ester carboxylesterase
MLHYQIQGEGPVWVFLHGFLESSSMWEALPLSYLPITTLFIDLPGHGKSEVLDQSPSMNAMAEEVQKVLVHLDIQKFIIVGHSMGAYVGLELSQHPGFQKLILLNSNCWTDSDQKKQDRLRVATLVQKAKLHFVREAIPGRHTAFVSSLISEANLMSPEAIAFVALAMRERTDFTSFVNAHPEQFIFIHGKLDRLVSVDELAAKIKGPRIFLLDCGHMAHVEAGEELMGILASAIKNA